MPRQRVVVGARVVFMACLSVGCTGSPTNATKVMDGSVSDAAIDVADAADVAHAAEVADAADGTTAAPRGQGMDAAVGDVADAAPDATMGDAASAMEGGGCHPIDVSAFRPTQRPAPRAVSSVCKGFEDDGGLVQTYATACLRSADTYADCKTLSARQDGSAGQCLDCLIPPEGGAPGVAATLAHVVFVDYGACVRALDPTDAGTSCAQAIAASAECAEYACASVCPVIDGASLDAFMACTNEAQNGGCASYALAAEFCVLAEEGDGGTPVVKTCLGGASIEANFYSFEHYLCGGP